MSVFFPAYNEEGNIETTVKKAVEVLKGLELKKWEVIIVDDGSKDGTLKISQRLAKEIPGVRVIHQQNGGYGSALRTGFESGKYEVVVYNDGDGQFDFAEIGKFLEAIENYDVLFGYRIKRADPITRLIMARGWNMVVSLFFTIRLHDVDCGFKMLRKEVIEKIFPLDSKRGGMVNAEIAIKAKRAGFKIGQVGVHHYPRLEGRPTGASIRVIANSFMDLFKLWAKK